MARLRIIDYVNIGDDVLKYDTIPGSSIIVMKKWVKKEYADFLLRGIQEQIPVYRYDRGIFTPPRRFTFFGDAGIYNVSTSGEVLPIRGYVYNASNKKEKGFAIFDWQTPLEILTRGIPSIQPSLETTCTYEMPSESVIYRPLPSEAYVGPSVATYIKNIMENINVSTGSNFNSVLINEYVDGKSSISRHSDREALGKDNAVYGISLGNSRKFYFYGKKGTDAQGTKIVLEIEHGDLMIMSGTTQQLYEHEIKKEEGREYRVSLTFRHLG
jgi:hypothetical protein